MFKYDLIRNSDSRTTHTLKVADDTSNPWEDRGLMSSLRSWGYNSASDFTIVKTDLAPQEAQEAADLADRAQLNNQMRRTTVEAFIDAMDLQNETQVKNFLKRVCRAINELR